MVRFWAGFTLLQRFTIVSAAIAMALAVLLSKVTGDSISAFAIHDEPRAAAELMTQILRGQLRPSDFEGPLPPARRHALDTLFRSSAVSSQIPRLRLWSRDGRLLYSSAVEQGEIPAVRIDTGEAPGGSGAEALQALPGPTPGLIRFIVPVRPAGSSRPLGAVEIFYDVTVLAPRLAQTRNTIWTAVPAGLFILYASVFFLVRRTSRTLLAQQAELVASHLGTFRALAAAIDAKDSYTGNHSLEVSRLAENIARAMDLDEQTVDDIRIAAGLHDLGKIAIPDAILTKSGPLTQEEQMIMRRHAEAGYQILQDAPLSDTAKRNVLHSHERWDGAGYPHGLIGEQIPLGARILTVADAYEAMTSDRPYRRGMPVPEALQRLRQGAGIQFDPFVVEVFARVVATQKLESTHPLQPAADRSTALATAARSR